MLRPISYEDLEVILHWRNSDKVRLNMMNQKLITKQEHHNWFEKVVNSDSLEALMYTEKDSNLGIISFTEIHNREYEWGFYTSPESPIGVGTRMCNEGLTYGFEHLDARVIFGNVISYNKKSIDFHLKLGFTKKSVDEDAFERDNKLYGIFNFEFTRESWINKKLR